MLYRTEGGNEWLKLELPYNSGTSQATLTVEAPYSQIVEYFIQVVDGAGNVAVGLDFDEPYTTIGTIQGRIYLPFIMRP